MRRRSRLPVLLGILTLVAGCSLSHLQFSQVSGFRFVSPGDSRVVHLPYTIRWTSPAPNDRFLVLFDRTPMGPGQTLLSLVPDSDPCREQSACPTASWLADKYMYLTDRPELLVTSLPDYRSSDHVRDKHVVTIIRIGGDKRIGESGLTEAFFVDRGGQQ